jgi:hypothetical protein
MTVIYTSLVQRSLDLAAGTPVNADAYESWGVNLAKLKSLGSCYRNGWLHNVLGRITPITLNEMDDYVMMSDLFITTKAEAQTLLQSLSRGLSGFAAVAGLQPSSKVVPIQLTNHVALYNRIAENLAEQFNITAPAPFTSTTISRELQAQIPFVRSFLQSHFRAA